MKSGRNASVIKQPVELRINGQNVGLGIDPRTKKIVEIKKFQFEQFQK